MCTELESKVIVTSSKKENKGKGRLKKQNTSKQEERATVCSHPVDDFLLRHKSFVIPKSCLTIIVLLD